MRISRLTRVIATIVMVAFIFTQTGITYAAVDINKGNVDKLRQRQLGDEVALATGTPSDGAGVKADGIGRNLVLTTLVTALLAGVGSFKLGQHSMQPQLTEAVQKTHSLGVQLRSTELKLDTAEQELAESQDADTIAAAKKAQAEQKVKDAEDYETMKAFEALKAKVQAQMSQFSVRFNVMGQIEEITLPSVLRNMKEDLSITVVVQPQNYVDEYGSDGVCSSGIDNTIAGNLPLERAKGNGGRFTTDQDKKHPVTVEITLWVEGRYSQHQDPQYLPRSLFTVTAIVPGRLCDTTPGGGKQQLTTPIVVRGDTPVTARVASAKAVGGAETVADADGITRRQLLIGGTSAAALALLGVGVVSKINRSSSVSIPVVKREPSAGIYSLKDQRNGVDYLLTVDKSQEGNDKYKLEIKNADGVKSYMFETERGCITLENSTIWFPEKKEHIFILAEMLATLGTAYAVDPNNKDAVEFAAVIQAIKNSGFTLYYVDYEDETRYTTQYIILYDSRNGRYTVAKQFAGSRDQYILDAETGNITVSDSSTLHNDFIKINGSSDYPAAWAKVEAVIDDMIDKCGQRDVKDALISMKDAIKRIIGKGLSSEGQAPLVASARADGEGLNILVITDNKRYFDLTNPRNDLGRIVKGTVSSNASVEIVSQEAWGLLNASDFVEKLKGTDVVILHIRNSALSYTVSRRLSDANKTALDLIRVPQRKWSERIAAVIAVGNVVNARAYGDNKSVVVTDEQLAAAAARAETGGRVDAEHYAVLLKQQLEGQAPVVETAAGRTIFVITDLQESAIIEELRIQAGELISAKDQLVHLPIFKIEDIVGTVKYIKQTQGEYRVIVHITNSVLRTIYVRTIMDYAGKAGVNIVNLPDDRAEWKALLTGL